MASAASKPSDTPPPHLALVSLACASVRLVRLTRVPVVAGVSAPAAELPVVDLDLGERAKPCPLVLHERSDSFPIRRLKGQRDSGRLVVDRVW